MKILNKENYTDLEIANELAESLKATYELNVETFQHHKEAKNTKIEQSSEKIEQITLEELEHVIRRLNHSAITACIIYSKLSSLSVSINQKVGLKKI